MTKFKITGDVPQSTERDVLGLYSLDKALGDSLGNGGFPRKSLVEVYGPKSIGKTTFCLSLIGMMSKLRGDNFTIMDFEGQDRETVEQVLTHSGFEGAEVHYIINQNKEEPEKTLGRFTDRMFEDTPDLGLFDSIGGYYPNAELEGEIGDRNIGQKALEMGQFTRRLARSVLLAKKPNVIFYTNHQHPNIGYMATGNSTTGGVTKKYMSHVRIALAQMYINKSAVYFDGSWLVRGKVDNNRYGYSLRDFYVFMVAGEGIHAGLTAMWECIALGLADLSSKSISESVSVTMDGQPYGKLRTIIRDRDSEPEKFVPFMNRLKAEQLTQSQDDEELSTNAETDENNESPKKRGRKKK